MPIASRVRRVLIGAPKDVRDPHAFHKLSLVALLAWVGLGADGLSSSAYGPDEAYRTLGEHTGLSVFLALATALTVLIISYGYSRIIEQFPAGGGGYVVASKILGPRVGVLSGAALLVDYVLTITVSTVAGADAIFSFLPPSFQVFRLPFAFLGLGLLTLANLRGVKESVTAISPIFGVFLLTHLILLAVVIGGHLADFPRASAEVQQNVQGTVRALGLGGAFGLFMRAYSMGGGTYTGIEAVSNGVAMMREPRVTTAKRTMVLMAVSLSLTAGGILLAYLLVGAVPQGNRTMNAVLLERVTGSWGPMGQVFLIVTLISEGALLFVAAQTGFLDGPRVMANMATDSWLPHRFSALSDRLTMRNGVILMAGAAAGALIYTGGHISRLVVMYAINVFLTFTLSNVAMAVFWIRHRKENRAWARHLPAHILSALLCALILGITIFEKFAEGGWLTLLITAGITILCLGVRAHYDRVGGAIRDLDRTMPGHEALPVTSRPEEMPALDPGLPVAILFVGGYSGLGRHALLTLLRMFPGHFRGVVFASVAVVDSDTFKGAQEIVALEERTQRALASYRRFAASLGLPSTSAYAVGTEVAVEAERLATDLMRQFPRGLVVAGQIIFDVDTVWNRVLHNETAFMIQRRLQHRGVPMIVLPVEVHQRGHKVPASGAAPPPS
jgi:amino acid transporter